MQKTITCSTQGCSNQATIALKDGGGICGTCFYDRAEEPLQKPAYTAELNRAEQSRAEPNRTEQNGEKQTTNIDEEEEENSSSATEVRIPRIGLVSNLHEMRRMGVLIMPQSITIVRPSISNDVEQLPVFVRKVLDYVVGTFALFYANGKRRDQPLALTARDVARAVIPNVDPGTVWPVAHNALRRLEEEGIILKVPNTTDRKRKANLYILCNPLGADSVKVELDG